MAASEVIDGAFGTYLLNNFTKNSILGYTGVLNPPLEYYTLDFFYKQLRILSRTRIA